MYTISMVHRVSLLLLSEQFAPCFCINCGVGIHSVLWDLGYVYDCYGDFHLPHHVRHHVHYPLVGTRTPVAPPAYWPCFIEALYPFFVVPLFWPANKLYSAGYIIHSTVTSVNYPFWRRGWSLSTRQNRTGYIRISLCLTNVGPDLCLNCLCTFGKTILLFYTFGAGNLWYLFI